MMFMMTKDQAPINFGDSKYMTTNQTPETTPTAPSVVETPAKKSKVRRKLILAGSAAGLVGIGSTLAANINLNSGENVEFGQGVARTTTSQLTQSQAMTTSIQFSAWIMLK
jgi:hypothetical protein